MTLDAVKTRGALPVARPDDLLEAAVELLATQGLLALTTDAVAARAGVPASAILRWWPSNEALVLDVLRREWLALACSVRRRAMTRVARGLNSGER